MMGRDMGTRYEDKVQYEQHVMSLFLLHTYILVLKGTQLDYEQNFPRRHYLDVVLGNNLSDLPRS